LDFLFLSSRDFLILILLKKMFNGVPKGGSISFSVMAKLFLWMGPVTECPPSVLAQRICPNANLRGFQGGMPHWSQDENPRRGGRERSERWEGEGRALSPPRTPFPPWGTPSAAGVAEEHPVPPILFLKGNCQYHGKRDAYRQRGAS